MNDTLCDKIINIVKEYVHPRPYYKSDKLSNYLLHITRTIENLHIRSMFPKESGIKEYFPSLIESLFLSEKVDEKYCSGQIVYLNHKNNDYIFTGDWGKIVLNTDFSKGSLEQELEQEINIAKLNGFIETFLTEIKYCTFTSILLNIQDVNGPHANLLMINKDSEGIILSLYDPLGYQGDNISDRFLDLFASSLAQKYTDNVVVKNRINISCPRGLQTFSGDQKGFCSIFSLLWIHIIIKIQDELSDSEKRSFFENLVELENCIIREYNRDELYNIVLVFASKLILYYIKGLKVKPEKGAIFYKEYRKQRQGDDSWGFKIQL